MKRHVERVARAKAQVKNFSVLIRDYQDYVRRKWDDLFASLTTKHGLRITEEERL